MAEKGNKDPKLMKVLKKTNVDHNSGSKEVIENLT